MWFSFVVGVFLSFVVFLFSFFFLGSCGVKIKNKKTKHKHKNLAKWGLWGIVFSFLVLVVVVVLLFGGVVWFGVFKICMVLPLPQKCLPLPLTG